MDTQTTDPAAIIIEVPILPLVDGQYVSDHLEIRPLTVRQRSALRRLKLGIVAAGHRLANDRKVESDADAVRWLLEGLAGMAEEQEA